MATTTTAIPTGNRAFRGTLCRLRKGRAGEKGDIGKGKGEAQELCGKVVKDRKIGGGGNEEMREGFHEQREKGERLKKTVIRLGNENKDLRGKVRWQEDKIGDLEAKLKGAGEEIGELGMKIDEMDMDICLKDREINELRGRLRAQWGENIRQF